MNAAGENLPLLLQKARENSVAFVRPVLAEHGLTEQQWRVIKVLAEHNEMSAQDIATESCILSPSLSRILARLDADGLILRKSDSSDQRALNIKLSAKGKRIYKKLAPRVIQQFEKLGKSMGQETLVNLLAVLQEFNQVEDRQI